MSAVFHLEEELINRDLSKLSNGDLEHLKGDIVRVYEVIAYQWIEYMEHLKDEYPYLFYSAMINNPFDKRCCS